MDKNGRDTTGVWTNYCGPLTNTKIRTVPARLAAWAHQQALTHH